MDPDPKADNGHIPCSGWVMVVAPHRQLSTHKVWAVTSQWPAILNSLAGCTAGHDNLPKQKFNCPDNEHSLVCQLRIKANCAYSLQCSWPKSSWILTHQLTTDALNHWSSAGGLGPTIGPRLHSKWLVTGALSPYKICSKSPSLKTICVCHCGVVG